MATGHIA